MQSRSSSNLKGIDVSYYQGDVDYTKVKAAGIDIVYMKATEGATYADPKLQQNYNWAKAAGLKVGFYHFFRARDEAHARQQAQFFVNNVKSFDSDCRYALDLETTQNLDKNTLSNLAKIFLEEVKRLTGKDVVIYTYTSFARTNISDVLKDYALWIAHYGVDTPGANPIWNSWVGFQYSSSGKLDGIRGSVDLDVFTQDIFLNADNQSTPVNAPPTQPSNNSNSNILELQKKLNRLKIRDANGNALAEDGINGPRTIEAVRKLQSISGITVDGTAGTQTNGAINQILSKPLIKKGARGVPVRYIQFRVGTSIDGIFGPDTESKVKVWQKNNKLSADGIVGPNTWAKLIG